MQLLARDLVQLLLGAEQVTHHAKGATPTEVREIRNNCEVIVGRPVVVEHHLVTGNGPANAALYLGDDIKAVLLSELLRLGVGPALRYVALIPGKGVYVAINTVHAPVLTLNDAQRTHVAVLIVARDAGPEVIVGLVKVAIARFFVLD